MSNPTPFRHYLISQDGQGGNIEVMRSPEQVAVLAFDAQRMCFVHCHVLLEGVKNRADFEQRGRAISQVGHPLMARLIEYGEDDGSFFYITEHVDGESLSSYLGRLEKLPSWMAMSLTLQAMKAIRACLERGDYLPPNLFDSLRILQTGPLQLLVQLTDFRLIDDPSGKAARSRVVKSSFDKQAQFLDAVFEEKQASGKPGEEPVVPVADLADTLERLLSAATPDTLKALSTYIRALESAISRPTSGEIAANFKPKALLSNYLSSFQEVARSTVQAVRIQSQKLDVTQPYAMRGALMKTGQAICVEQVPPRRLAGPRPSEAAHQVHVLPKAGKFPNIVPVVYVEENEGVECLAETAVEGVSLGELLTARHTLQVQEVYLVLAGLDTALGQVEKAGIGTRRLRLEDIFLFTGFGKDNPRENGLLSTPLNEWPGFSVVLRAHGCLHSMTCRGTDPAQLLPVEVRARPDVELFWNGGWMSALSLVLLGLPTGQRPAGQVIDKPTAVVTEMLQDELAKGREGYPSARAAFLARFARVLQESDLTKFQGDVWPELSGSTSAQGHAMEVARAAVVAKESGEREAKPLPRRSRLSPVPSAPALSSQLSPGHGVLEHDTEPLSTDIGFAELLIAGPGAGHPEEVGLRPISPQVRAHPEEYESSWNTMHEEMPGWIKFCFALVASVIIGAVLAHLSGHAAWQVQNVKPKPKDSSAKTWVAGEPKVGMTADKHPPQPQVPVATPVDPAVKLHDLRAHGERLPMSLLPDAEKAASGGNVDAMVLLGRAALHGDVGPVDEKAAFHWFDTAAEQNDREAKRWLAECYLQGWGTNPDLSTAVRLLNTAVGAGDSQAKNLLGVCYARGLGVPEDDAKALALFTEAYDAGVVGACGNLGSMYLRGQGTGVDAERGLTLLEEGAKRGDPDGMLMYAQALEAGTGGRSADPDGARKWYQQAAHMGNITARTWCRKQDVPY